ncbi:MAG: hypothetical protein HQL22_05150 [Candidatus Omnitrophica bacterium]|nr:hypothetical protein [Candidatus Omnitrophota bacterium]
MSSTFKLNYRAQFEKILPRGLDSTTIPADFPLILTDPPSFARHEGNTFSVKKALAPLVASAMNVLNPGGVIFVATNYSLMSHDGLCDMVSEAAGERQLQKMERFGQDIDFPGSGLMQESYLVAVLALMKNIPS